MMRRDCQRRGSPPCVRVSVHSRRNLDCSIQYSAECRESHRDGGEQELPEPLVQDRAECAVEALLAPIAAHRHVAEQAADHAQSHALRDIAELAEAIAI